MNTTTGVPDFSHDQAQRAAEIVWSSRDAYFHVNASNTSVSLRHSAYMSLEFRVKLECDEALCSRDINPAGDLDFSVQLVSVNDRLSSPVRLSSVAKVYRPVGGMNNSVFQTVRIPIQSFAGVDMRLFRGVRFSFDGTAAGRISLGNVRLVKAAAGAPGLATTAVAALPAGRATGSEGPTSEKNEVVAVRRSAGTPKAGKGAGPVQMEIELTSTRDFGVTNALPTLYIGDKRFRLSRFADGRSDRMIFTIDEEEYRRLRSGTEMKLVIGGAPVWNFGPLRKR